MGASSGGFIGGCGFVEVTSELKHSNAEQEPAVDNLGEETSKNRKYKNLSHVHIFMEQRDCESEERTIVEEIGEEKVEFRSCRPSCAAQEF